MPDPFAFFTRVLNPNKDGFKDSEDLSNGVLVCEGGTPLRPREGRGSVG